MDQAFPALAAKAPDASLPGGATEALALAPDAQATPAPAGLGRGGVGTQPVAASGSQAIDGLLAGVRWASADLSYSFPADAADYGTPATYPDPAPFHGFAALGAGQQAEAARAFQLLSSYTQLTFAPLAETTSTHATIRLADSSSPATSYAYYPNTGATGGDAFYGATASNPVAGDYGSFATLHEIGHTLGLKHGQETSLYGALPADQLDNEYSLMNYPTYIGATENYLTAQAGSAPQAYMMDDIAALQHMYGANLGNAGQAFTYTWSPSTGEEFVNGASQGKPYDNHVFSTVWTGGATSTYDFSNYDASGTLDLRPGKPVDFSPAQLADLGYSGKPGPGKALAQGDIYNALLHQGDTSTEVSGLVTGNGDDAVHANDVFDTIWLGSGDDTVFAGAGGATIHGGGGSDTLVLPGAEASYAIGRQGDVVTVTDSIASRGQAETLDGVSHIQFSDLLLAVAPVPVTIGAGPDAIHIAVSEDAYLGDAQFTVSVDGAQVAGTQFASALHSLGEEQGYTVLGSFGAGQHVVSVDFLNDLYGGTPSADRNLYVDGIASNGAASQPQAALLSAGSASFLTPAQQATDIGAGLDQTIGSGPGAITLAISEDAYLGDAQFTVSIDGSQVGDVQTAVASHSGAQSQSFTFLGDFGNSAHTVAVDFLNDAYGGSPDADRNLYVDSITAGGATSVTEAALFSNGDADFIVPPHAAPSSAAATAAISPGTTGASPNMAFLSPPSAPATPLGQSPPMGTMPGQGGPGATMPLAGMAATAAPWRSPANAGDQAFAGASDSLQASHLPGSHIRSGGFPGQGSNAGHIDVAPLGM